MKPKLPYFEKGDSYFNEKIKDFNNNENFKDFNNEFKIYKRIMDHVYNKEFFKQLNIDFEEDIKSKNTPKIGDLHSSITNSSMGSSWIKYCKLVVEGNLSRNCRDGAGTTFKPSDIFKFFLYKNGSNICSAKSFSILTRIKELLIFIEDIKPDIVKPTSDQSPETKSIDSFIPGDYVIPDKTDEDSEDRIPSFEGFPQIDNVPMHKSKKRAWELLKDIRERYFRLFNNIQTNNYRSIILEETWNKTFNYIKSNLKKGYISNFFKNTILLKFKINDNNKYELIIDQNNLFGGGPPRADGAASGRGRVLEGVWPRGLHFPPHPPTRPAKPKDELMEDVASKKRTSGQITARGLKRTKTYTYNLYNDLCDSLKDDSLKDDSLKVPQKFYLIFNEILRIADTSKYLNLYSDNINKLIEKYFYNTTSIDSDDLELDVLLSDDVVLSADDSYITTYNKNISLYEKLSNKWDAKFGESPPLATLTQLEPVAEEEEPDGTEIEENDETQLEVPPPPPPNDVETPQHNIGEKIINNLYLAHLNEKEFLDYILEVIRPSFEIFEYMYKQNSAQKGHASRADVLIVSPPDQLPPPPLFAK